MARPLKYLKGEKLTDPIEVVREVLAGRYVIEGDKRQHPSWIGSQQLHQIRCNARRGIYHRAIPNPEHPDHQEARPLLPHYPDNKEAQP